MKRVHLAMVVAASILAASSAYSLAAINQVYELRYEWYSQYEGAYTFNPRDASGDRWLLKEYPQSMSFGVFTGSNEAAYPEAVVDLIEHSGVRENELEDFIYVYCSLGWLSSPEYRAKVTKVAQRGSTVEVMVSMNSPEGLPASGNDRQVSDIARINKAAFSSNGWLWFVFKNQDGITLYEQFCFVSPG